MLLSYEDAIPKIVSVPGLGTYLLLSHGRPLRFRLSDLRASSLLYSTPGARASAEVCRRLADTCLAWDWERGRIPE